MNIFYIHTQPEVCAHAMSNKHVVKMILESAQLLSTAHHELQSHIAKHLYKPTHKNHPSAKWVRQSSQHYNWLYAHFVYLNAEYFERYQRVHKTWQLHTYLSQVPSNLKDNGFAPPPPAMPDEYKVLDNPLLSYRKYYEAEKLFTQEDATRYKKFIQ